MNIEDRFRVGLPVEDAWRLLLDVERIAPCMPGAQLQEVEGDEYRGIVKVKVGPITAQYKGAARIAERDESAHRAVIEAQGRDTRGQGNASATVTASLTPDGDATQVVLDTDVTITGKVAQFGRGVIADVSSKLLAQFVDCLETSVLAGGPGGAAGGADVGEQATEITGPAPASVPSGPRQIESADVEAVDLLRTAGMPVLKRLLPVVVGIAVVVVVLLFLLLR